MLIDHIQDVPHAEEPVFDAIKTSTAPVVLWGAGEVAWYVCNYLRQHGIYPVCFCDNNSAKHGKLFLGLPVYPYDVLKGLFNENGGKYQIVLAIGIQYKEPILAQLSELHEENPIWHLRGYEVCGEKITYSYIRKHITSFEQAYTSLADDLSRRIFINVLNAKISGNFNLYSQIMSQNEYFDPELVTLTDTEVFLDLGAYKGRAIIEFANLTKHRYKGIIALEPDKNSLQALRSTVAKHGIERLEIHNKGAWNTSGVVYFSDGREGGSRVCDPAAIAPAATSIEVDAVDNILHGRRVTYIDMDIEGAERNAIFGAEQTIKNWKPKLAVSVYHRREDLFSLLLLLKSFVPQYRFHMRHYTEDQTQTILYAV